jgi:hypothetical protein
MRIGIVADTHIAGDGRSLPLEVLRAFRGVDLILHCGDLECLGVLDYLETVAPVLAVRGYEDPREPGHRLADSTRVVSVGGLHIGMVHDIRWPGPPIALGSSRETLLFPPGPLKALLTKKFGRPVDIVAFGDTHKELIALYDGVLFINPGSPTCPGPRYKGDELGTVAILEIRGGLAIPHILKLERAL